MAQLGATLSEEVIFRGFLLTRFSAWLGARRARWITAGVFALVHIPHSLSNDVSAGMLLTSLLFLLAWGWTYNVNALRMGNVAGLALLHAIYNVA